jgi:hypothetical protein
VGDAASSRPRLAAQQSPDESSEDSGFRREFGTFTNAGSASTGGAYESTVHPHQTSGIKGHHQRLPMTSGCALRFNGSCQNWHSGAKLVYQNRPHIVEIERRRKCRISGMDAAATRLSIEDSQGDFEWTVRNGKMRSSTTP